MERLTIPFVAGAAAGALCARLCQFPADAAPFSGTSLCLAATAAVLACRQPERKAPFMLLFFFLGFFCFCSDSMLPDRLLPDFVTGFPARAAERLRARILSVPYRDGRCAALVCAVLTGDRSLLDPALTAAFRSSGASHILALSGLHMGLVCALARRGTLVLGNSPAARYCRCALCCGFALFYTIATGATASAQRACIFIVISELAAVSQRRRSSPAQKLNAALTLQLALRPRVITSAAFQLSYMAMAGIIILNPILQGWFPPPVSKAGARFNIPKRIWEITAMSLSCQVFTAPVAYIHFGTFPQYFLLANLIALPLTSVMISLAVLVVILHCAGICPAFLVSASEAVIHALIRSMEIISGM
ncbi:MAG: ComEC/Rec2 family competence protein [Bacteroidales bacterium]|nr:ComEC/Rec2 family competence protein [Bacteroidales bacterium]